MFVRNIVKRFLKLFFNYGSSHNVLFNPGSSYNVLWNVKQLLVTLVKHLCTQWHLLNVWTCERLCIVLGCLERWRCITYRFSHFAVLCMPVVIFIKVAVKTRLVVFVWCSWSILSRTGRPCRTSLHSGSDSGRFIITAIHVTPAVFARNFFGVFV